MAIHNNFSSLARRLQRLGDNVVRNSELTVRRAALAAYSTLIVVTPEDTGRARAGWIISFVAPRRSDVEPVPKGSKIPIGSFQSRALNTISNWTIGSGDLYISNSVEYIEYLENGHSAQRPEGMTVHGVEAAMRVLRSARLLRD